jgi:enoyl-[acyl-carrier-protein] reductase (NADH)
MRFSTQEFGPMKYLDHAPQQYGLSVHAYKTNNVLKTEITSADVAAAALQFLGPAFSKTTGAQIPVDGGNDRVI